jgi:hypothetical protein
MSSKRGALYWLNRINEEREGGPKLTDKEIEEMLKYRFSPDCTNRQAKALEKIQIEWTKEKNKSKNG